MMLGMKNIYVIRMGFMVLALLTVSTVWATEPANIQFEKLLQSSQSWDGRDLPQYIGGTPEITLLKVSIPPGETLPEHKHPVINAALILSGEITVFSESGETRKFRAGDPVVELVDTWHHGVNTGTEQVVILVFYAGVKGVPLSIKK